MVDALVSAAAELVRRLPVYGTILDREADTALIDVGNVDGVVVGDELLIIRRETLDGGQNTLEIRYSSEDILGRLEVTAADELVAQGDITKDPFFDLINVGDKVILIPENVGEDMPIVKPVTDELYRTILKIRS